MNYQQFGDIDIQILEAIQEVLKFSDPSSVKASIILNRIRTIVGVKKLDAIPDLYEACKSALELLEEQYKILLGSYPKFGKYKEMEKLEQALAKAESK